MAISGSGSNESGAKLYHDILRLGYYGKKYSKTLKTIEIVEEALKIGEKIVIFSYYLNTLSNLEETITQTMGDKFTGLFRIDGKNSNKRQTVIDSFSSHNGPTILFAQITSGGIGINLQAASRMIICEPQVKPSIEDQAISRSHRMGQLKPVIVHKLLTVNTVEEDITEALNKKRGIFDAYARRTDLGDRSAQAIPEDFTLSRSEMLQKAHQRFTENDKEPHNSSVINLAEEGHQSVKKRPAESQHQPTGKPDSASLTSNHEIAINNQLDEAEEKMYQELLKKRMGHS